MITFKQFLAEQDEGLPDWASKFRRLSPEQLQQLPAMNRGNIEGQFRVGNIAFDQERGIGAVPFNQEVEYKGFVAMMMPADFLRFTTPMEDDQARVMKNVKLIQAGFSIGSPWLWVDFTGEKSQKTSFYYVRGHEGRARSKAITNLQPNIEIPVHVIAYGANARAITPEIIKNLNSAIVKQDTEMSVVHNRIRSIWLNGSHISLI